MSSKSSKQEDRYPKTTVTRSGVSSKDNPLVNTHEYYKNVNSASRGYAGNQMYSNPPIPREQEI